ncbi:hypothetical protein MAP00_004220 [Monascus purpureus]|nr:hypothetical protein MAP00_004220 [Monascus purpureus]
MSFWRHGGLLNFLTFLCITKTRKVAPFGVRQQPLHRACDSTADVKLTFSGLSYSISPKDYVGARSGSGSGSNCLSTIVPQKTFKDADWLVGDIFLKNVYTVFDYDADRIGFAPREDSISSSKNTTSTSTSASSSTGSGTETSVSKTAVSTAADATRSVDASSQKSQGSITLVTGHVWAILAVLSIMLSSD